MKSQLHAKENFCRYSKIRSYYRVLQYYKTPLCAGHLSIKNMAAVPLLSLSSGEKLPWGNCRLITSHICTI